MLKNRLQVPSFTEEKLLGAQGYRYIAGIDEAGRGSLAGPVVAAAVILPCRINAPWLNKVRDSKQLSPLRRELLFRYIREYAVSVGIGVIHHTVIDSEGIVQATRAAMAAAVKQLAPSPEFLLVDFMRLPGVALPQKGITGGDSLCLSIACASIIAKVSRDHLMIELNETYPGYGLARHKGYGTREHLSCLRQLGPCSIHRRSFKPVRDLV